MKNNGAKLINLAGGTTNPRHLLDLAVKIYYAAHDYLVNELDWANQLDWQRSRDLEEITGEEFVSEACWVVLHSGLAFKVADVRWPYLRDIFGGFESLPWIVENSVQVREKALATFNSARKIDAMLTITKRVNDEGWEGFREKVKAGGVAFLEELPMIGKVTSFHLAKNIGFPVAKPDRHLVRIASACGYGDVQEFCEHIGTRVGEKVTVVDLVLWRYAVDDPGFAKIIAGLDDS